MQNIDLICLGKLNAGYYAAGVAELLTEEVGLTPMTQTDENAAAWQAAVICRTCSALLPAKSAAKNTTPPG